MKIEKKVDGDDLLMKIEGRIDTTTAPELEEELKGNIDGVKNLTFDFEKVDYISSAGLRVLLSSQKIMNGQNGSMKLTGVSQPIMEIFEVTGFSDILTIE